MLDPPIETWGRGATLGRALGTVPRPPPCDAPCSAGPSPGLASLRPGNDSARALGRFATKPLPAVCIPRDKCS